MGDITTLCKILVTSKTWGLDKMPKLCYRFIYGHTRAQVPKGSLLEDKEAATNPGGVRVLSPLSWMFLYPKRGDEWQ